MYVGVWVCVFPFTFYPFLFRLREARAEHYIFIAPRVPHGFLQLPGTGSDTAAAAYRYY